MTTPRIAAPPEVYNDIIECMECGLPTRIRRCRHCILSRATARRTKKAKEKQVMIFQDDPLKNLHIIKATLKSGNSTVAYQQLCAHIEWLKKQNRVAA